jgi:TIR domain
MKRFFERGRGWNGCWSDCDTLNTEVMPVKPQVFVSYAADTKPFAKELTQALEQHGFEIWADFKNLASGPRWQDEIGRALDRAESFVILVQPNSQPTPRQEAEWQVVLQKAWSNPHKRMIPVVVGGKEPPPFLRNWACISVDSADGSGNWTHRVLRALQAEPGGTVRGLSAKDRQERQRRWREMNRAVEELAQREAETGEFPMTEKR